MTEFTIEQILILGELFIIFMLAYVLSDLHKVKQKLKEL